MNHFIRRWPRARRLKRDGMRRLLSFIERKPFIPLEFWNEDPVPFVPTNGKTGTIIYRRHTPTPEPERKNWIKKLAIWP